ncbi:MAG: hypothetical protein Q8R65_06135 [Polynucleobacter sp.]|nr:hypothetical protein [Polynucleobacter sp.]MDZ4057790.1 hypothetical protein [Polynucleobacter sp.]
MKRHLTIALLATCLTASPSFVLAQGASQYAPGQQKADGQSAKQYAPGQQKEKGKGKNKGNSDDSAKDFAPGQGTKDGDRPMKDRMQDRSKGGDSKPNKGKN